MAGREAAYALKVQDYARVDIRLSADGIPIVVEVNANPYLERTSAFALAALQADMGYTTLINRIVEIAGKCLLQRFNKQGEPHLTGEFEVVLVKSGVIWISYPVKLQEFLRYRLAYPASHH